MGRFPRGGIIGKTAAVIRWLQEQKISLYAANACYFMVLAVFPGLLLLLGLLRQTTLEVERLAELFYGFFPEPLAEDAEALILLTYDSLSDRVVGISAVTALWSAGRGIHGILTGMNAIYGVEEHRGFIHTRLLSMAYLFGFLVMLLMTLGLPVFARRLGLPGQTIHPALQFLGQVIRFRSWILLVLQTAFFALMFTVLPDRKNGFRESLPGAALAAFGWQLVSDLYGIYMARFSPMGNIYGSVYAVALSMLWLYVCMSILFYGAAVNVLISGKYD